MYLTFEPRATYQGLPPVKPMMTLCWLRTLLLRPENTNFVLSLGGRVIAHAGLVDYPDFPDEREIIIFVHQDHQHRGWGRKVFLATLKHACVALGLRRAWLTVEWDNTAARGLYESIGFVREWAFLDDTEVEMGRPLGCERCLKKRCPIFTAELLP